MRNERKHCVARLIRRDVGYENDYEGINYAEGFEGVGPFTFDRAVYEHVVGQVCDFPGL